jgi:UrcA family protein
MFRRFAVSTLLPLAALVTVGAAQAGLPEDVTIDVSYAGLDLSTPAGVAVFRGRINQAVNEICGRPDARDMAAILRMQQCRSTTANNVEPEVAAQVAVAQEREAARVTSRNVAQR